MSTFKYNRLDKNNAAVLLVDHQTGLFSLVRDIGAADFKNNVLALASAAKFFNLPTILTTSFEQGSNGVIIPEQKEKFPDAPFIPRPGQINAWDNEDFVKAVEATGKKQLIVAGIVTDVCVTFCALSALEAGMRFLLSPMPLEPLMKPVAMQLGIECLVLEFSWSIGLALCVNCTVTGATILKDWVIS